MSKQAAKHHEHAARHHKEDKEAAKHHEADAHEKAAYHGPLCAGS